MHGLQAAIHRIKKCWRWFKCRAWRPHNRLHIKTLPVTWTDRCERLPHAMFQILTEFIDQECSPGIIDWEATSESREVMAEMRDHYIWWKTVGRDFDEFEGLDLSVLRRAGERLSPLNENGRHTLLPETDAEKAVFQIANEREEAFKAELNRRMKRIVDLSPHMWT